MDFSWLTGFITSAITSIVGWITNLFYDFCNAFIVALAAACSAVLSVLPTGSFNAGPSVDSSFLPTLNWFLPVSGILNSLSLYFVGYLLYIGSAPVLRWFKVTK